MKGCQEITEQVTTFIEKPINEIKHNDIKQIEPFPWNKLLPFKPVYLRHILKKN